MTPPDGNNPAGDGPVESRLDDTLKQLFEQARDAAESSYSPYSGFKVGAAIKLSNNEVVTGTNMENVSYGLTICAERAAVVQAISRFGPKIRIVAVAIANLNGGASPPCGACRQVLAEFIELDASVVFPLLDGICAMPFSRLMPLACELRLQ
jgi:cytidine deaminase